MKFTRIKQEFLKIRLCPELETYAEVKLFVVTCDPDFLQYITWMLLDLLPATTLRQALPWPLSLLCEFKKPLILEPFPFRSSHYNLLVFTIKPFYVPCRFVKSHKCIYIFIREKLFAAFFKLYKGFFVWMVFHVTMLWLATWDPRRSRYIWHGDWDLVLLTLDLILAAINILYQIPINVLVI